ncbi:MAG: S8 family serine peptidase [Saprospiraceae bacterium]
MKQIILLIGLILPNLCFSQIDKSKIFSKTNRAFLLDFANRKSAEYYENYNEALKVAKEKEWTIKNLFGIDKYGNPIYIDHTNTTAASITNTDDVNNGGSSGLSLDGNGFNVGLWEAGPDVPLVTHFNLVTAGTQRVIVQDGTSSVADHATHVAGTLIGDGSSNSSAKGMASQAQILAYGADNDVDEMATAASAGLLISNHSYGTASGWRCDNGPPCSNFTWFGGGATFNNIGESRNFGQYNETARDWDEIAFNAPFYSIFKSAGNDNGDVPSNGDQVRNSGTSSYVTYNATIHPNADGSHNNGYDIIPTFGTAKNIITVGAVQDDGVSIANFSGTGPTDDGRIKPDIVGNGLTVLSSTSGSNTEHQSNNGTSMATPNIAGSALLLQEHYEDLFGTGSFMLSATLKGLIIHTATDLGNPGPDYQFGWGLMNTLAAVNLLTDASNNNGATIVENTYNGSTQNIGLRFNYGASPKITLCYTDPAGVAQTTLDNTTPNLVNDLDIRVGSTMPFVLNPNNPAANATTGDNDLDNVEQLGFIQVQPIHILTIEHEGTIANGTQDYSLILSGLNYIGTCNVVDTQTNIEIEDGNYCNTSVINTSSIINNKITNHESMDKIVLKPGFNCGNGSKSTFKTMPPWIY